MVHAACHISNLTPGTQFQEELKAVDEEFLSFHGLTRDYIAGILPPLSVEAHSVVASLFK